jgi:hypothetical protein
VKIEGRGNVCGPNTIIKPAYIMGDVYSKVIITPYDTGMADIEVEGHIPEDLYLPEGQQVAGTETIKGTCNIIADILLAVGPPHLIHGYYVKPGYMPDGEHNAPYLLYACGKPKGHHWHIFHVDQYTRKVIRPTIEEQVGHHDKKSLAKTLAEHLRHIWPSFVA